MTEPTSVWKYTRLYTREDGESAFEDLEAELHPAGPIGALSEAHDVAQIIFRETPPTYDYDFHNAPARQFIIMADGSVDVETSTGERRRFTTGDVLLVEDVTGKGHRSQAVDGKSRRSIFVTLR